MLLTYWTVSSAGALAKDLRPGEAALLHSARLIQFTIAGVDFIPLNELPEGRPLSPARKVPILFRLDPDLVVQLRASGPGYQTRVNALLREAVLGPKTRKARKAAKATKAKPARKASRLKPNAKGKAAAGLEWLRSQRRKAEAAKRRQQRAKARA